MRSASSSVIPARRYACDTTGHLPLPATAKVQVLTNDPVTNRLTSERGREPNAGAETDWRGARVYVHQFHSSLPALDRGTGIAILFRYYSCIQKSKRDLLGNVSPC